MSRAFFSPLIRPRILRRGLRARRFRYDSDGQLEKRCTKCGDFWPHDTEFFYVHEWALSSWCRACRDAYIRRTKHARLRNSAQAAR